MSNYIFYQPDKARIMSLLPQLFRILHSNMSRIAPTGYSYEEDEAMWISYMVSRPEETFPRFVLMYDDDVLAGYCQYSSAGDTLTIEEIEIDATYQRTYLFYRFCQYLCAHLEDSVLFIDAYVNKENANCLRICKKLQFIPVGASARGSSIRIHGNVDTIKSRLNRNCSKSSLSH